MPIWAPPGTALSVDDPLSLNTDTPGVTLVETWDLGRVVARLTPVVGGADNTITETDLASEWTSTGSPRQLNIGDILRMSSFGRYKNNGTGATEAATTTMRLRAGATEIAKHIINTAADVALSAAGRFWRWDVEMQITSTGVQFNSFFVLSAVSTSANSAPQWVNSKGTLTAIALTLTDSLAWGISAEHSVANALLETETYGVTFTHIPVEV